MIKVGTIIKVKTKDKETGGMFCRKYTVKKVYPHMVLCENAMGIRSCFSIGDLIVMNIVKQSPELEALKMDYKPMHPKCGYHEISGV